MVSLGLVPSCKVLCIMQRARLRPSVESSLSTKLKSSLRAKRHPSDLEHWVRIQS